MIRGKLIKIVEDFLQANYTGPVAITTETSEDLLSPPYAVVRVASGEVMFPGQAEVWDLSVMVGVFHDADMTSAASAEANAAALFAVLDDPSPLFTQSSAVAWSAWERTGTDASISDNSWQHVGVWRAIVAPV